MNYTKKDINEIKKTLNGCELWSLSFENCVGFEDGFIIHEGKKLKGTNKQWIELWKEYFYQEFGTNNVNDLI